MSRTVRTEMALGKDSTEILSKITVAVVGLGGVGGHTVETLARAGIGHLILIDNDKISESNINRQLIATIENIGNSKASEWKKRVLSINPDCTVDAFDMFYLPDNHDKLFDLSPDFIVDAVDTVTAKIDMICEATKQNIPIISSMGLGNKLDPTRITITDLAKTSMCPLARVMRRELKKHGIEHIPVAFSDEEAIKPLFYEETDGKKVPPASVAWVPSVAGIMIGGYVITSLCGKKFTKDI